VCDVDWRLLRVIACKLATAFESSCGGRGRCCAKARRGVVAEGKSWSPAAGSDQDASEASSSSEVVSPTAAGAGRERAWGFGWTMGRGGRGPWSGDCLGRFFPEAIQDTQDFLFCASSSGS
jgi:hypothetical protein